MSRFYFFIAFKIVCFVGLKYSLCAKIKDVTKAFYARTTMKGRLNLSLLNLVIYCTSRENGTQHRNLHPTRRQRSYEEDKFNEVINYCAWSDIKIFVCSQFFVNFSHHTCTHTTCFRKHQKPPEVKRKRENRMLKRIYANDMVKASARFRVGAARVMAQASKINAKFCEMYSLHVMYNICVTGCCTCECLLHCNAVHSKQTVRLGRCDDL